MATAGRGAAKRALCTLALDPGLPVAQGGGGSCDKERRNQRDDAHPVGRV